MIFFKLFVTLAVPTLLGYGVVALIYRKKEGVHPLERLALAWGVGLGLLGILMFCITLLGIPLNFMNILIPASAILLLFALYLFNNKLPLIDQPAIIRSFSALKRLKKLDAKLVLTIAIALAVAYVFFDAVAKPLVNYDDLWRYGCIAKIIYVTGTPFTGLGLHLTGYYPYLNPLSQAWIYMGIGEWNDALGKIVFALCFASFISLFYVNLRAYTSRLYALLFTFLMATFPLITYHAGTGYADFMQTYYYTVGALYLYRWISAREGRSIYISALFFGIGNFVKRTGIEFWALALLALAIYIYFEAKREAKTGIKAGILAAIVSLPWLLYKQSFIMTTLSSIWHKFFPAAGGASLPADPALAENLSYGIPTLSGVIYNLARRMFTYADWHILWFTFIVVLIFCWKEIWGSKLRYLILLIALDLMLLIYAFLSLETYRFLLDGTLANRLMMYFIPTVFFTIALGIYYKLKNKNE